MGHFDMQMKINVSLMLGPWSLIAFQRNSICLFLRLSDRSIEIYADLPWMG